MKRFLSLVFVAVLAAACSSSTAPVSNAGDPSLLITNNLPNDYVYVTWQDGQGIVGRDSVPPLTANRCIRFTAQPDSAYFQLTATMNGHAASFSGPFFNPADLPAWTFTVSPETEILGTAVDTPC